jgi:putative ABC transport system substrate-binding protein
MGARWLQLLKEIAPRVTRVVSVFNPEASFAAQFLRSAEAAAQQFAVEVITAPVHNSSEIEAAFTMLGHESSTGLMFPPDGFTNTHHRQILELTARYRLPAIFQNRSFTEGGGLMSYGIEAMNPYRQAATYVDRILRGEKAEDLPVKQPTKFEFVIAKALGLAVPLTLQVAADDVIE